MHLKSPPSLITRVCKSSSVHLRFYVPITSRNVSFQLHGPSANIAAIYRKNCTKNIVSLYIFYVMNRSCSPKNIQVQLPNSRLAGAILVFICGFPNSNARSTNYVVTFYLRRLRSCVNNFAMYRHARLIESRQVPIKNFESQR